MKNISKNEFLILIDELTNTVIDSEHLLNSNDGSEECNALIAEANNHEDFIKNKIVAIIQSLPNECFLEECSL